MKAIILSLFLVVCSSFAASHAVLKNRDGKVLGEVNFMNKEKGLMVKGKLKGLNEGSTHAFHIHEKGKCEGNFKSAGSHFDPYKVNKHGSLMETSHAGDLGNIKVNSDGASVFEKYKRGIKETEKGGSDNKNKSYSIIGKSVIIHAKKDDLNSQPSGDAGERIACGIISYKKS